MAENNTITGREERISYVGSGEKIVMSSEPIAGFHLEDLDFHVEFMTVPGGPVVTMRKEDLIRQDADTYICPLDTSSLAPGKIYGFVVAMVPDGDFSTLRRVETDKAYTFIKLKEK